MLLLLLLIVFTGCQSDTGRFSTSQYTDGTYCAEVKYYYSETGTQSTYTLLVEIENNELVKIKWPNGGWLDNSHFRPPNIDDGYAKFTSDRGVEYTVSILGEEGDCSLSSTADDEDDLINQMEEDEAEAKRKSEVDAEQDEEDRRMRERRKEEQQEEEERQQQQDEEDRKMSERRDKERREEEERQQEQDEEDRKMRERRHKERREEEED